MTKLFKIGKKEKKIVRTIVCGFARIVKKTAPNGTLFARNATRLTLLNGIFIIK